MVIIRSILNATTLKVQVVTLNPINLLFDITSSNRNYDITKRTAISYFALAHNTEVQLRYKQLQWLKTVEILRCILQREAWA